jgi:hypothetical protein
MMPKWVIAGLVGGVALFLLVDVARSHVDHVTKEDYTQWKQPGNGASCCNDKDCAPTQARWNGRQWEALFNGKWISIPHERVLKHEAKDGNAHLCADYAPNGWDGPPSDEVVVFCFVPPAARG